MDCRLGFAFSACVLSAQISVAEPDFAEINGYFNPRPDAYVDLDALVNLNFQSDMPDGASIGNLQLDFERRLQTVDSQNELLGNLNITAQKSDGVSLGLGAYYSASRYVAANSGGVDRAGRMLSFVDVGTADPRSFGYSAVGLGVNDANNAQEFQVELGFGRGRTYDVNRFYQTVRLISKLRDSGVLQGEPDTPQLYAIAAILDTWDYRSRQASDDAHGLPDLVTSRQIFYLKQLYKAVWQYLVEQGLVDPSAEGIGVALDFAHARNTPNTLSWNGGAEARMALFFNSGNEIAGGVGDTVGDLLDAQLTVNRFFPNTVSILDTNDSTVGLLFAYQQYRPVALDKGHERGAKLTVTDDLVAASANMGVQYQLTDYTAFDVGGDLVVASNDGDSLTALGVDAVLSYELGPTSSLRSSATAYVATDIDFTYFLSVNLVFDLK